MNILIITSSPNKNGLTASCGNAARIGAEEAGARVQLVNLNELNVGHCSACGNGWGPCLDQHQCQVVDDFQNLHNSIKDIDALVFITPVYWGEMSESAKAFFDRLRRNEAWKKESAFLQNKPVIAVAAAGGSGNGAISCLTSMERLLMHLKSERFDFISITQKSRNYKLEAIKAATKEMVKSLGRNFK